MGMYTKFAVCVAIGGRAPTSFLATLDLLVNHREMFRNASCAENFEALVPAEFRRDNAAHAFLSDNHASFFGNSCDEGLFGFSGWKFERFGYGVAYILTIGAELKDTDSTIDKFWTWISPWIVNDHGLAVGWCQHEDYERPSTVIVGKPIEHGESHYLADEIALYNRGNK